VPRAVFVRTAGGADVLRLEERDPAPPGEGQVLLRTTAAGVNFIDVYHRTGLYPRTLPFVAGLEGAGRVEAVGEGVRGLALGDRVAWASVPGSYADTLVAPAVSLLRIPEGISDETAAGAMLQGMTAHYLAHGTRQTRDGDTALVHAAAGGTGLLLVQTLKLAGATVFGTCSTGEKAKLAREAGCDRVIDYTREDVIEEIRRLTDGNGVDVVYDSVGQATFELSLRSLRARGLLVLFGQSSGPVPPINPLSLSAHGSLFVTRPTLAHYTATREDLEMRARAVFDAVGDGSLRVRIGARYPLDRAADAHRALETRRTTGKVLLLP
jgi:NADPH2:quinone reductase